jgi:gliding motility-associated-like protein
LNTRYYIAIITLVLFTTFSHGQVTLEPACAESVEKYGVTGYENSEFYWYIDQSRGTIIDGAGTDTITIRWGYGTGEVEMEVHEITASGCRNIPSRATVEIKAPEVDLGYDFPEICDEDSLVLNVGTDFVSDYEILWHDGSTRSRYVGRQTDTIWVRVIDGDGCIRYDTVSLLVNPLPQLNIGNDTILCDQSSTLTLEPGDFASYSWSRSNEGENISTNSYLNLSPSSMVPDTIMLTVTDYNSCTASDTMVVFPCDLEELFRDISNTITPNNDGENDVWNIPYMQFFDKAVLEIFDRWGRLVYRTDNVYEEPWDGKSKGKILPMDSYYYVLNLNVMNTPPLVGTVNLIR